MFPTMASPGSDDAKIEDVMEALKQIQLTQTQLLSAVESMARQSPGPGLRPSPLPTGAESPAISGPRSCFPRTRPRPWRTPTSWSPPSTKSGFASRIVLT